MVFKKFNWRLHNFNDVYIIYNGFSIIYDGIDIIYDGIYIIFLMAFT